MAAFCKKAMAQGSVIVVRFMGRYPPTARSVYKPPNSSDHHKEHDHHALLRMEQSAIRRDLLLPTIASMVLSIDHQGAEWHWLSSIAGDADLDGDDDELLEEIERVCMERLSIEQRDVAVAIKGMVTAGKISPRVYIILLKLFALYTILLETKL